MLIRLEPVCQIRRSVAHVTGWPSPQRRETSIAAPRSTVSGLASEINWSEMVIAGGRLRPVLPLGSRKDPLFRNGTNNPSIKLHRFLDLMWECTWDRSGSKTAIASVNSFRSIAERKSSFHELELRVVKTNFLAGQLHQIGTNPREAA